MIPLGLSGAEWKTYKAALVAPAHRMRVRVELRSLDNNPQRDLTGYLADGVVHVDSSAQVTRAASLVFNDPKRRLAFNSDDPSDISVYMDRMLRVTYDILIPGGDWVACPVFTGPIVAMARDGDTVTLDCHGKEALARGVLWKPLTIAKQTKKTAAIRLLMGEIAGETRFDFPDLDFKLPKPISLHRDANPWRVAKRIAHSMGRQLFYDGRGTLRLRTIPSGEPGMWFTGREHVVGDLQVSYTTDEVVNAVAVFGGVPKGAKTHVHAFAVAPANHPLSPQRLGRDGAPLYLMPDGQIIRDGNIKTVAEAQRVADRALNDGLMQQVEVSFDSIPVPFLDPLDLCHVATDDGSVTFRLDQFSLPLVAGEAMTVGYNKDLRRHAVRRHPKHHRQRRRKRRGRGD